MISEAPPFWWRKADWRAWALYPLSALYAIAARHRLETGSRHQISAPVLCVGNFTVGGSGKTPVAIALAKAALQRKLSVGFLSRGYGGAIAAPHLVDAEGDIARHVGDEPLTLARLAPTVVTPDRLAGAELLIAHGCDFIIMDDGFQSAQLCMDQALIVVDAERGIGNGHTIPGGPMRARLVDQMRHADALVTIGDGPATDAIVRQAARAGRPVHRAIMRPCPSQDLHDRHFLAFAGIGNPDKFFRTVKEVGGRITVSRPFPDHHLYSEDDADDLLRTAKAAGCEIVTTMKDAVRLRHGGPALRALARRAEVLKIEITFELDGTPGAIIDDTLTAWHRRRLDRRPG